MNIETQGIFIILVMMICAYALVMSESAADNRRALKMVFGTIIVLTIIGLSVLYFLK